VRTARRSKGLNLGAEIRAMEMAIREPTEQQKSLGNADLSGAHRLFRGVAGSGKSVLLALNAAHATYQLTHYTGDMFSRPAHRPRVLVLCFNRTLTFYLRQRIEDRYKFLTYSDLPGDYLTVTHMEGLIYDLLRREPSLQTPHNYEQLRPALN
jgi:superfamily I DNA and RNA helicase